MRTFEEIYQAMCSKGEQRFSIKELLDIYANERSWAGTSQQVLELQSFKHEITGVRPGSCPGCNMETLRDMYRWMKNYEATAKPSEPAAPTEKPKRKRIGE